MLKHLIYSVFAAVMVIGLLPGNNSATATPLRFSSSPHMRTEILPALPPDQFQATKRNPRIEVYPTLPIDHQSTQWFSCGMELAMRAGLRDPVNQVVELARYSVDQSPEFLRVLMAVAYTESRMRHGRTSHANAVGILQVTYDAAVYINQKYGLGYTNVTRRTLEHPRSNIRLGSAYLRESIDLAGGGIVGALVRYNAGVKWLTRLLAGGTVPVETARYVTSITHILERCGNQ